MLCATLDSCGLGAFRRLGLPLCPVAVVDEVLIQLGETIEAIEHIQFQGINGRRCHVRHNFSTADSHSKFFGMPVVPMELSAISTKPIGGMTVDYGWVLDFFDEITRRS